MLRGVVGCPRCQLERAVQDGVVQFGASSAPAAIDSPDAATLAALLDLAEPGRLVLSDGAPASLVAALTDEFGAMVVALDAPPGVRAAAVLNGAESVPVAGGAARAVLLLRPARSDAFIASAARALAPGGRLAAAAAMAAPHDVRVMARDASLWVGERESVTAPVALRRAGA